MIRRRGRAVTVLIGAALAVSACGSSTATPTAAPTTAPSVEASTAPSAEASTAPTPTEAPQGYVNEVVPGSGTGLKVGYISGGDSIPFVKSVSDSIAKEAQTAGLELISCNSALKADLALKCAQSFALQGLSAVANWQFDPAAAKSVCDAYGNLPTASIDVPEFPCQKVFTGIDNNAAGIVLGTGLGNFVKSKFNCEYDLFIGVEAAGQPEISRQRMGSTYTAFQAICGTFPNGKFKVMYNDAISGSPELQVQKQFADILTANPDAHTILMASLADEGPVGAFAAAKAANRVGDLWVVAHGADSNGISGIRDYAPNWVGDSAYTPELYGTMVVPVLVALAKGYEVPSQVLLQATWVDSSNIDTMYPKP